MRLELEEADSFIDTIEELVKDCLEDFPDEEDNDISREAAALARASITDGTRGGHERYEIMVTTPVVMRHAM